MKKKIGTRAKKIVLSSLCVVGLLAFAAPVAKGQEMTALTGTHAAKSIGEEFMEFATLARQGQILAEQAKVTYERYKHLKGRTREIKKRIESKPFKAYKGKFNPVGVLSKVGMANYQAAIADGLISQVSILAADISRLIATTKGLRLAELATIVTASAKQSAATAATAGMTLDPGPIIAAVSLMGGNAKKDGVKATLSFVIKLLTEVNKSLMELSFLVDIAYDAVEEAIRMGSIVLAVTIEHEYDQNGQFKILEGQKEYAKKKKEAIAKFEKERKKYMSQLLKDKPVHLKTVSLFK